MSETKKSNKKLIIGIVCLVAVIAILAVVFIVCKPGTTKGAKAVTIEVTDNNEQTTTYNVNTDAEYLSEVFDEIDDLVVEGTTSEYGLYIDTVNGVTADYNVDGSYWAIYVNGDYGMYGADQQPVADGDTYALVYTVYVAQ